jgi:hypothetical protein
MKTINQVSRVEEGASGGAKVSEAIPKRTATRNKEGQDIETRD